MTRRWPRLAGLALLGLLAGCGTSSTSAHQPVTSPTHAAPPVAQAHAGSLSVDGVMRTYELFVPSTLDPAQPAPLMVILHPCPHTAAEVVNASGLDAVATADRFVAVYPQGGVMAASGGNCWNAGTCCTGLDDVSFISQLIDSLIARLHIDPARVFVAGFSFGASMAHRLACQLSDKVVGVAAVSGALVFGPCQPAHPVSVLMMHGTTDTTFPYKGGGDYGIPSVASVAKQWAGLDGCAGAGAQTVNGIVTTTAWTSCNLKTTVRLELIAGVGHEWFGLEPNAAPGEPNASATVWDFFSGLPTRST